VRLAKGDTGDYPSVLRQGLLPAKTFEIQGPPCSFTLFDEHLDHLPSPGHQREEKPDRLRKLMMGYSMSSSLAPSFW
jgi:hypothetical protein